ncbi:MAG: enterochelin esterase [Burkholderiaceae bacterium]
MGTLFALLSLTSACLAVTPASSVLKAGESIEARLSAGGARTYTLPLQAGDYVKATIEPTRASGEIRVLAPDGSRLRKFTVEPGKKPFSFVAEVAGDHTLRLEAGQQADDFRLRIDRIEPLSERMALGPTRATHAVPAIEALKKSLPSPRAVEQFWQQVEKSGTPLVTPITNDGGHQLVTFLWRGNSNTKNVAVLGSFHTRPLTDYLMDRIPNTDVWQLTVKLPAGSRFVYTLSINDPLVEPTDPRDEERAATRQADPRNPEKSWDFKPGADIHEYSSMVELPGAPPQPWIAKRPGVPEGKLESATFNSDLLGNERRITIYLPPGYRNDGRAADLVVLFDENAYVDRIPTPTIVDNLISERKISQTVVVFIANSSRETRIRELAPNARFADFLAGELIPWVCSRYHVTDDPSRTVVAGSSFGGIAATYAAFRHPGVFGNVLCQSGSFWWAPDHRYGDEPVTETGWLAKQFIDSPKLPIRFYMDAGFFEVDYVGSGGAILEPSRNMRDVLLAKDYDVHYREFASGHDYLNWRGTLADGLIVLLGQSSIATRSAQR